MTNKFSALRQQMSPESQARAEVKAQAMLAEMPLNELRQARGLSQKMLADVLHVQQPSIAKMEKRTDMYLSTLRSHIEAMGGQLEVVARFPEVKIIHTELWHLDQDELGYAKYTREQALKHLARWHSRGEKCTAPHPQGFKAQISQHSCKWCPYSANGTGHCTSQFGKRLEAA